MSTFRGGAQTWPNAMKGGASRFRWNVSTTPPIQ